MRYGKPMFRKILYRGGTTHMYSVMANPTINSTLVKSDHRRVYVLNMLTTLLFIQNWTLIFREEETAVNLYSSVSVPLSPP
jgi:hypothetical protein